LSSEALSTGLIVASYGRRFLVEAADGRVRDCVTRGKRNDYACGDRVAYLAQDDTQGVIDHHLPRNTLLYRSDVWKQNSYIPHREFLRYMMTFSSFFNSSFD
jgi:putative ribosome biogenesis GTPase RsgA